MTLMSIVNAIKIPIDKFKFMLEKVKDAEFENGIGVCLANSLAAAGIRKIVGYNEETDTPVYDNPAVSYKRNILAYYDPANIAKKRFEFSGLMVAGSAKISTIAYLVDIDVVMHTVVIV